MDDEENQASTSKLPKKSSSRNVGDDRNRDDQLSNSETSLSQSHSGRSRKDMAHDGRHDVEMPITAATTSAKAASAAKEPERKKSRRKRHTGRVEKRRHSSGRRPGRRVAKRKMQRMRNEVRAKETRRHSSVSTIVSRLSSRSGAQTPTCITCGHRCCLRRYEKAKRQRRRNKRTKVKKSRRRRKVRFRRKVVIIEPKAQESKCVQAGSRCKMLSPLFVNTNMIPRPLKNSEVSVEMIYEGLRNLSMWRSAVETSVLREYILRHYPVNQIVNELDQELREKLRIAAVAGIVTQPSRDQWCLSSELVQRELTDNHVTLFWKIYADTLKPVRRKDAEVPSI